MQRVYNTSFFFLKKNSRNKIEIYHKKIISQEKLQPKKDASHFLLWTELNKFLFPAPWEKLSTNYPIKLFILFWLDRLEAAKRIACGFIRGGLSTNGGRKGGCKRIIMWKVEKYARRSDTCGSLHNVTTSFFIGNALFPSRGYFARVYTFDGIEESKRFSVRSGLLIKNTGIRGERYLLFLFNALPEHWHRCLRHVQNASTYLIEISFMLEN